jgi:hypothetical protein
LVRLTFLGRRNQPIDSWGLNFFRQIILQFYGLFIHAQIMEPDSRENVPR